eukprot:CAMPEP_0167806262 /NCGR_PEP_ID=MMETSP0111_2-20121227/21721_1 /TAXON_ID=91324 /ORGANISM="Lotharella globosa, Strain CCCM811" /LENGTH=37 /DNA_ID= /DNA_START= /DNA_END= /DNA_ORIENTATION=
MTTATTTPHVPPPNRFSRGRGHAKVQVSDVVPHEGHV